MVINKRNFTVFIMKGERSKISGTISEVGASDLSIRASLLTFWCSFSFKCELLSSFSLRASSSSVS